MSNIIPSKLESAADVRKLVEALAETPVGEIISYRTLSDVVGFDVRERRYPMSRAINLMLKDDGALFSNVRKVGFMRPPAQDGGQVGVRDRAQTRRRHFRSSSVMKMILDKAPNDMPPDKMRHILQEITAAQTLRWAASDRIVKLLPAREKPTPSATIMRRLIEHLNGRLRPSTGDAAAP